MDSPIPFADAVTSGIGLLNNLTDNLVSLVYISRFGWDLAACAIIQNLNLQLFVQKDSLSSFSQLKDKVTFFADNFGSFWNFGFQQKSGPSLISKPWDNDYTQTMVYMGSTYDLPALTADLIWLQSDIQSIRALGYSFFSLGACNSILNSPSRKLYRSFSSF